MFKLLRKNFLTGLLIVIPLSVTIYLIVWLVSFVTDYIFNFFPEIYAEQFQIKVFLRITAFILILFIFVLLGMLLQNIFIKKMFRLWESILLKIPIINIVYSCLRDLFENYGRILFGAEQSLISKVCLVKYPSESTYSIGFVTSENVKAVSAKDGKSYVGVLIPTAPTPFSGLYIMYPEDEVKQLDVPIQDALIHIITGGIVDSTHTNK